MRLVNLFVLIFSIQCPAGSKSEIESALTNFNRINSPQRACGIISNDTPIPRKEFLDQEEVPSKIKTASNAVRALCWCGVNPDYCSTIFSLGSGRFLTNQHVMDFFKAQMRDMPVDRVGKKCDWIDSQGKKLTVKIIKEGSWDKKAKGSSPDHSKDLVMIEIKEMSYVPAIDLGDDDSPYIRQKAFLIGFPGGRLPYVKFDRKYQAPLISVGEVKNLTFVNGIADFIGVNGMSGGPVLTEEGKLLGVFWGKDPNERDESFFTSDDLPNNLREERASFIPLRHIKKFIKN